MQVKSERGAQLREAQCERYIAAEAIEVHSNRGAQQQKHTATEAHSNRGDTATEVHS